MIFCKELNKEFDTKEEMFKALRENAENIISIKKAQVFKSCEKGMGLNAKPIDYLKLGTQTKKLSLDDDYYYIAINSTRILDSHTDLHLNGIWNKTTKDQQGKVYLVADHKLELDKTIAKKEHVEMFVAKVPFSVIGQPYEGETEVLIYKVRKDKVINKTAKEWLESGDAIQASVRMRYMKLVFCLNSDAKDDVDYKKNYDELYPLIANKEDFDQEIMYFWAVKQAMNVYESSLVLFGSNSATGQITIEQKLEPLKNTPEEKIEPEQSTQKQFYINLLNQ